MIACIEELVSITVDTLKMLGSFANVRHYVCSFIPRLCFASLKGLIIKSSEHSCSCKDAPKTKVRKVGGVGGGGETMAVPLKL